jgi:hypothetical protein
MTIRAGLYQKRTFVFTSGPSSNSLLEIPYPSIHVESFAAPSFLVNVQNRRNATSKLAGIPPLYSFKSFIASVKNGEKPKHERS